MSEIWVELDSISIDGGTQARAQINSDVVTEYAEALLGGVELPPIIVFFDGTHYWLGDGFHRYHAHRQAGRTTGIKIDSRTGTVEDAKLYACGANKEHGLRRSNEDKRKAVLMAFDTAKLKDASDSAVAKHCGVTQPFVSNLRRGLKTVLGAGDARTVVRSDGKTSTMNVGNIGGKSPGRPKSAATLAKEAANAEAKQAADDAALTADEMTGELERAQRQIQDMAAEIKALTADDTKAELAKQVKACRAIEARLSDEMETVKRQDAALRKFGRYFEELRKITGAEKNAQVVEIVRETFKQAA